MPHRRHRHRRRQHAEENPSTVALLIGSVVVAAISVGAYIYLTQPSPTAPAALPTTPAGTVTSTLTQGQQYTFGGTTTATTVSALTSQLQSQGWTSGNVVYFGPTNSGTVPQGFQSGSTSYVATATWNSSTQAVPAGITATSGPASLPSQGSW